MQKQKTTLPMDCTNHNFKLLESSKVRPGFHGIMCDSENCWYGFFSNDEMQLCSGCFPGFTSDEPCVFECQDPQFCDCTKCKNKA